MARARRDGVIGSDGRFVRAKIGSVWWLAHERLTLVGVVAWRIRAPDGEQAQAALAVFSGEDPARRRLIRWIGVTQSRLASAPAFRIVDLLEPTPAPWPSTVQHAIAAADASAYAVVRVERCDGETPFDPAAVATIVELDPEAQQDSAVDGVWLLEDAQGHFLGTYALTPYKPEPYEPTFSMGRYLVRHVAVAIVLGSLAVLVTDLL